SIRQPTLKDEWDLFLTPETLLPTAVHVLTGPYFFGYSWNLALLFVFVLSTLGLRWRVSRPWPSALLLGFVTAWAVMDLRTWVDHAEFVVRAERRGEDQFPLGEARRFGGRAAGLIGKRTWTRDSALAGTQAYDEFIDYSLAEHPYRPKDLSPPADF